MKKEIKIYNIVDLVRETVVGSFDLEASLSFARETARIASLHKSSGILLDVRETTVHRTGGFQDSMRIAQEFTDHLMGFDNRIAVLIPDNPQRMLLANQVKSCLQVKGVRFEIFTDFEAAMEWLSDSRTIISASK